MKTLLTTIGKVLSMAVFVSVLSSAPMSSEAQIHFSVNININRQPAWGPDGYDYAQFYYFPDLNIYYDVDEALYYFIYQNRWMCDRYLPYSYAQYDLYRLYKVVLNGEPRPWLYNDYHYRLYSRYRGNRYQSVIRYSNDPRYRACLYIDHPWIDPDFYNRQGFSYGRHYNDHYNDRYYNHNDYRNPASYNSRPNNSHSGSGMRPVDTGHGSNGSNGSQGQRPNQNVSRPSSGTTVNRPTTTTTPSRTSGTTVNRPTTTTTPSRTSGTTVNRPTTTTTPSRTSGTTVNRPTTTTTPSRTSGTTVNRPTTTTTQSRTSGTKTNGSNTGRTVTRPTSR